MNWYAELHFDKMDEYLELARFCQPMKKRMNYMGLAINRYFIARHIMEEGHE